MTRTATLILMLLATAPLGRPLVALAGPSDVAIDRSDLAIDRGWVFDASLPDACTGVNLRYYERIEAQGFLGLATPSASYRAVASAVAQNLELQKLGAQAHAAIGSNTAGRLDPLVLQSHFDHRNLPYGGMLGLLGFDFRMAELCTKAKQGGLSQLVLACGAGKSKLVVTDGDKETDDERLACSCFVSTTQQKNLSWDAIRAARLGSAADNRTSLDFSEDDLGNAGGRADAYVMLVRSAVESAVQGLPTLVPRRTQDVAGVEDCPQSQGLPVAPQALAPLAVRQH